MIQSLISSSSKSVISFFALTRDIVKHAARITIKGATDANNGSEISAFHFCCLTITPIQFLSLGQQEVPQEGPLWGLPYCDFWTAIVLGLYAIAIDFVGMRIWIYHFFGSCLLPHS